MFHINTIFTIRTLTDEISAVEINSANCLGIWEHGHEVSRALTLRESAWRKTKRWLLNVLCCVVFDMEVVISAVEANRPFLSRVYPIHQPPVNRLRWKSLSTAERAEKELAESNVAEGGMGWCSGCSLDDIILDWLLEWYQPIKALYGSHVISMKFPVWILLATFVLLSH